METWSRKPRSLQVKRWMNCERFSLARRTFPRDYDIEFACRPIITSSCSELVRSRIRKLITKKETRKKMDNDETNGDGHGRKSHCPLIDVGLTTDIYEADLLLQTVLRNAIHTRNRSSF